MLGTARKILKTGYNLAAAPMRNKRRAMRAAMPQANLEAKHTAGSKLLPHREALLETLPKNSVAAEIGVAQGDYSQKILDIVKPKKLHLVDAWEQEQYIASRKRVESRFASQIEEGLVEINLGYSTDVLATFPDEHFDWVYIDTNHSYETTRDELLLAERKVKSGGRILGDDYCLGNIYTPVVFGVIAAVNEFCIKRNWKFDYLTLDSNGYVSFSLSKIAD